MDLQHFTPLITATLPGNVRVWELLLKKGAQVGKALPDGVTALHFAAMYGRLEVARLLVAKGAAVDATAEHGGVSGLTPLHLASANGQARLVELLLAKGADNDRPSGSGPTAPTAGSLEVPRLLLPCGASAGAAVHDSETALDAAVSGGHLDVVRVLLAHGAGLGPGCQDAEVPAFIDGVKAEMAAAAAAGAAAAERAE